MKESSSINPQGLIRIFWIVHYTFSVLQRYLDVRPSSDNGKCDRKLWLNFYYWRLSFDSIDVNFFIFIFFINKLKTFPNYFQPKTGSSIVWRLFVRQRNFLLTFGRDRYYSGLFRWKITSRRSEDHHRDILRVFRLIR